MRVWSTYLKCLPCHAEEAESSVTLHKQQLMFPQQMQFLQLFPLNLTVGA